MTPLKRQKREEITSPQLPKQALATPTRPTPEKKAKTKAANDQQLRSPPPKGQIISEGNFCVLNFLKKQRNYFIASRMNPIKKSLYFMKLSIITN